MHHQEFAKDVTVKSARVGKGSLVFFEFCRRDKSGCKGGRRRKSQFLAMTNTGNLILVRNRLETVRKPKAKVSSRKGSKSGYPKVSWRGNICNEKTCPTLHQKSKKERSSRDSRKKASREKKSRRKEGRDKGKNREKNRHGNSRRKDKGKNEVKYFLYFQMGEESKLAVTDETKIHEEWRNFQKTSRRHNRNS